MSTNIRLLEAASSRDGMFSSQPPPSGFRATFAAALRSWRGRTNVPLKAIAAELGVSIATVSAWELGRRFPTARHFERLADYIGEPPCRLFCVMADKCVPIGCGLAAPETAESWGVQPTRPYRDGGTIGL